MKAAPAGVENLKRLCIVSNASPPWSKDCPIHMVLFSNITEPNFIEWMGSDDPDPTHAFYIFSQGVKE